jgi:hypothetical protein
MDIKSKTITFKKDVKIEVIKDDSSSTEDEDVTAISKLKMLHPNKSKKVKV